MIDTAPSPLVTPRVPDFDLGLEPGRVVGLVGPPGFGLTRLGMAMLAQPARFGMVAIIDVRGWMSPMAAWEVGLDPERLVVVRCADPARWPQVAAALLEGLSAVYAEVPFGMKPALLRRLTALARARRRSLALRPVRGDLPGGVAHLRVEAGQVGWDGVDQGHGRLTRRRLVVRAGGKVTRGMDRTFEVEDDGTDAVRVVPRLAIAPAGRAI